MSAGSTGIDAAFAGALGGFRLDAAFALPGTGVTALFGASGSGKTTVLRCIAGLERLAGRFSVAGDVWQDSGGGVFLKPHRRPVGYVPQEASLFPHLSVRGNLTFGARRAARMGGAEIIGFDDAVELMGCGHLLERGVGQLSGGERQRVAIGRALLSRPRLLLLDEPLSALDRGAREEILGYLEAMHRELSIPVLYVSHDIGEVTRLAQRIVVMAGGRNVAEGAVEDVLERLDLHPHTGRFEAGVVLTATVTGHDEAYRLTYLDHHGQTVTIPHFDARPGDAVRFRVRARDVALSTEKPAGISIRNVLEGTVAEIREEAGTAFAETLVDIGGARLRARLTRHAVDDLALAPGKRVYALVKSITFDRRSLI